MLPYKEELLERVSNLPKKCGVYLFKDINNEIIYIGKAINLKNRVRSYFNVGSWSDRPKLHIMVPRTNSIEVIVTNSEKEALLLEATLIKNHKPKYNVALKDDKKYPWLAITYGENFPRLIMTRMPVNLKKQFPKAKVYGPYVGQGNMWETIKILRKVFPLRQRPKPLFKDRPCLNYHIGLCLAPCQNLVNENDYNKILNELELYLSGKQNIVLNNFKLKMEELAKEQNYEQAAKIRDKYLLLKSLIEKQRVVFDDNTINQDIFCEYSDNNYIVICLLQVREGKLTLCENIMLQLKDDTLPIEAYSSFIENYYSSNNDNLIPQEILLQHNIEDIEFLEEYLKSKKKTKIFIPVSGIRQELIKTGINNAKLHFNQEILKTKLIRNDDSITQLQSELKLTKEPYRIECFDISNIQGVDNVASMVVFENGKAKKSDYRKFKIKSVEGSPNDFGSMQEVIFRRYSKHPVPDLIIIDGGKGQLNAAIKALKSIPNIELNAINIVGLAKKREEIYFPNSDNPHLVTRNSQSLHLLQNIRDEAHRFAITFHRKLRAKRVAKSQLSEMQSIGPKRTKLLLDKFGSLDAIKQLDINALSEIKGISDKLAKKIYNELHKEEKI